MATAFILCCMQINVLKAQTSTLSVQGILKKTNGDAVPDGPQSMTFKLYTVTQWRHSIMD